MDSCYIGLQLWAMSMGRRQTRPPCLWAKTRSFNGVPNLYIHFWKWKRYLEEGGLSPRITFVGFFYKLLFPRSAFVRRLHDAFLFFIVLVLFVFNHIFKLRIYKADGVSMRDNSVECIRSSIPAEMPVGWWRCMVCFVCSANCVAEYALRFAWC